MRAARKIVFQRQAGFEVDEANGIVIQMHPQNAVVRLVRGACETGLDAGSTTRRRIAGRSVVWIALAAGGVGGPAPLFAASDTIETPPAEPATGGSGLVRRNAGSAQPARIPARNATAGPVAAIDLSIDGRRPGPAGDRAGTPRSSRSPADGSSGHDPSREAAPQASPEGGDEAGDETGIGTGGNADDDADPARAGDPGADGQSPVRTAAAALERLLHDGRDSDDNDFLIGVATSTGPSYSGASDIRYSIRPAARLTWRGYSISTQSVARASARVESTSGGERTGFSGPLRVRNRFSYGFGATINRGRDVSAEGAAIGLRSLPSTIYGRVRLRYALDERTSLSATLIADVLDRQKSMELPISIGRHYVLGESLLLGLNAGMNFVNQRSMDNDYGISPEQSAASGKPVYRPKAGIREVAVSAALIHEPDRHWIWMTQFSLVRLVGEAARSPLVRQKLQPTLMFGVAWRFDWN